MSKKSPTQSIHEIPLETTGAIPARRGFELQDQVAASYCIQMISEARIREVWNEMQDDVTLIWKTGSGEEVEFIQVKSNELEQLWSIALLCAQDGNGDKKSGTSIFERSLARHACSESCRFRIVTARSVKDELISLTLPLDSSERLQAKTELDAVVKKLREKLKGARSPNNTDGEFWVTRTVWQVVHALEAVQNQNLIELAKQLEALGHLLLADQRSELYQKIVRKLWDAALAKEPDQKKIKRDDFLNWLSEAVETLSHPGALGGQRMNEKMEAAHLPKDAIMAAHESRKRYRLQGLVDRYSAPTVHAAVEGEIVARLNKLRARLDAGDYPDDGPLFHKKCLDELDDLYNTRSEAYGLGLAFLQGCMYSITDRCGHRFRRVRQ